MQSDMALWRTSEDLRDRHPVIKKKFAAIPHTEIANAYGLEEIPRLVECIMVNQLNPTSALEALTLLKGEIGSQIKKVVATQCHAVESCLVLLNRETTYSVQVEALKVLASLVLCQEAKSVLGDENTLRKLIDYLDSSDTTILQLGIEVLELLTLDRMGGELFLPMLPNFHPLLTRLLELPQAFKLQAVRVLKNVGGVCGGVQLMIEAGIVDQVVEIIPALIRSYSTGPALPSPIAETRKTSYMAPEEQGVGSDHNKETHIFLQNLCRLLCEICQEPGGRERVYNGGGLQLLSCITLSWKVSEALAALMPITLITEAKLCAAQEVGQVLVENLTSSNQTVAANSLMCIQNINEDPTAKILIEELIPSDLKEKFLAAIAI